MKKITRGILEKNAGPWRFTSVKYSPHAAVVFARRREIPGRAFFPREPRDRAAGDRSPCGGKNAARREPVIDTLLNLADMAP